MSSSPPEYSTERHLEQERKKSINQRTPGAQIPVQKQKQHESVRVREIY